MLNLQAFSTDQLLRAADRFATFGDWDRFEQVRNELESRGVRP